MIKGIVYVLFSPKFFGEDKKIINRWNYNDEYRNHRYIEQYFCDKIVNKRKGLFNCVDNTISHENLLHFFFIDNHISILQDSR